MPCEDRHPVWYPYPAVVEHGPLGADSVDSHEYAGQADLETMVDLVRACWRQNGLHTWLHVGDIYWWLRTRGHDLSDANIRLWTDAGRAAIAISWTHPPREGTAGADILVRPECRGSDVEPEILRWLEERAQSLHSGKGRDQTFEIGGYADPQWESYIEGQGYVPSGTAIIHSGVHWTTCQTYRPRRVFTCESREESATQSSATRYSACPFQDPTPGTRCT